jgi:uncharacterized membrane protein HdeD (DUF308 family)
MASVLARNWWALALRGVLAILFGLAAFVVPGITLTTLVLFFGAYVLVDGIFTIIAGVRSYGERQRWWVLILEGIAGILLGVLTFLNPGLTAVVLLYFIAAWAILTGVLEIIAAIRLRKEIEGEWALALSGVLSLLFGVLLIISPLVGLLTITFLIGAYALLFGIFLIVLAFRLRGHDTTVDQGAPRAV